MSEATTADIIAFCDAEARSDAGARRQARDLPEGHSAEILPLHEGTDPPGPPAAHRGVTPGR